MLSLELRGNIKMFKAILYKEWLKVRWAYIAMLLVSLLVLVYIWMTVSKQIEFNEAKTMWSVIIFRKYKFFSDLQYIPLVIGFIVGIAQYAPEALQSRLKLTLHLPVKENKILIQMLFAGFVLIGLLFLFIEIFLTIITGIYFPSEIVSDMLTTIYPWILSGFAVYFAIGSIFVEPVWSRRITLIITSIALISILFTTGDFTFSALLLLTIVTFIIPFWTILTGYNFKRGIK